MRARFPAIRTGARSGGPLCVSIFDPVTGRWLATFTVGAHTVLLRGPLRTLREGAHRVVGAGWVRTYPRPFREDAFDPDWMASALAANARREPDLLAIAMQYIAGSAP